MRDVTATILTLLTMWGLVALGRVLRRRRYRWLARLPRDPAELGFDPFKYFIWADWVTSTHDGDRHWISADRLVHLYHIDPRDCRVLRPDSPAVDSILRRYPWVPILCPRPDGDYTIPDNP
jgi:hypothetical protein